MHEEETMEMELISRETIKPSKPTPPHLKIYPLSFIDSIVFRNYIPSLFFYHPNEVGQECDQRSKICELKKSLSQVLCRYYPFAGRFRGQLSIECNDEGVLFLVTRITGTKLSTILQNPIEMLLNPLFPDELQWEPMSPCGSIVAIQISCFSCASMAISVCMSHKVGDANTLFNFVNDWATMSREKEKGELLFPFPSLDGGVSIFPQKDLPVFPERVFVIDKSTVCRRFVFQASKIKSLKSLVSSHMVQNQNPTRIEVVVAWIYKCGVSALGLTSKTTSLRVAVNLRRRMVPPLLDKCVGNMFWYFHVINPAMVNNREIELPELVRKIKAGLCDFCDKYPKKIGGNNNNNKDLAFISEFLKPKAGGSDKKNQTLFIFTSWCGFPMYEVDFGWGKPIWVTTSGCPAKYCIVFTDTREGNGIEAIVTMEEKDMAMFERNVDLLQYASLNPNCEKC